MVKTTIGKKQATHTYHTYPYMPKHAKQNAVTVCKLRKLQGICKGLFSLGSNLMRGGHPMMSGETAGRWQCCATRKSRYHRPLLAKA
jgi:hypothetical protein